MLKEVPVNKIWVTDMGCFHCSPLKKFELEYVLSHVVRMSQRRGEWVEEFTTQEFIEGFNPIPINATERSLRAYFLELIRKGYLKFNQLTQKISVTEKFEDLCKQYVA